MIIPKLNKTNFAGAVKRIEPAFKAGKLGCAFLGVRQDGREMVASLNAQGQSVPGLRRKVVLIASISKAMTGTAVARLVDQGVVHWSDPLSKYLEDMKDGSDNETITLGDVFLHRTGYEDADPVGPRVIPAREAYKTLLKQGLKIKPGTAFMYASTTYWFINALVFKVLGCASMQAFLDKWLFTPCGMTNTIFHPAPSRMMACHYYDGAKLERFMRAEVPGSGLWSNIDDLLKFGQAVITPGQLMKESTFRDMVEAYPMRIHGAESFSCRTLGWVKEIHFNNQPLRGFFHGGATGGVLWCDVESNFVAVFMSNKWGSGNDDAFRAISAFYGS